MLSFFKRAKQNAAIAQAVYGTIVAQARQPALYAQLDVPDTLEGRFDMVVLHLVLASNRLEGAGEAGRGLAQAVFDVFAGDMDRTLREAGVGDLSVPRKMKTVAGAFYGRWQAYSPALEIEDRDALAAAIGRNVWATDTAGPEADRLADYALAVRTALAGQDDAALLGGRIDFADAAIAPRVATE